MPSAYDRIFEELVNRYRKTLTAAAYHLCDDWEAACDLVQDTLLDAYRSLDSLRDQDKAGAWLYTILRRKAAAFRRGRRLETELTDEPSVPPPDDVETMVRGIVIEQMAKLATGRYWRANICWDYPTRNWPKHSAAMKAPCACAVSARRRSSAKC